MRRQLAVLALLVLAFGVFATAAHAAPPTCFGMPATIVGTNGDNTLNGTQGPDVIVGRGGDDEINGRGGNDLICAGRGNDFVDAGPGNDRVRLGPGNFDFVVGGPGDDVLNGGPGFGDHALYEHLVTPITADFRIGQVRGEGVDRLVNIEGIHGGAGNDILIGSDSEEFEDLTGMGGDDVLIGLGGPDGLWGFDGNDVLIGGEGEFAFYVPGLGDDLVVGHDEAFDLVDHFEAVPDAPETSPPVQVDLGAGTSTGQGTDVLLSVDAVAGTDGDDTLIGNDDPNELYGFGGNDAIQGRGGDDFIAPGLGNDTVDGGANDAPNLTTLTGGDVVIHDFVSPALPPSETPVVVDLAADTSTGHGTDTLANIEHAVGAFGDDTIRGDDATNALIGLGGSDTIEGRGGDDLLDGDVVVFGETFPGMDTLDGGLGTDICVGGETLINCESTTPPAPPAPAIAPYAALGPRMSAQLSPRLHGGSMVWRVLSRAST